MATIDPYVLAGDVLDALVSHFASEGVDLPSRRYRTIGVPATDCEQVVVSVPSLFSGLPGSSNLGPLRPGVTNAVELALYVIRCVPKLDDSGNPPDPGELETSAEELLTDAATLRDAVFAADKAGVFGNCNDVVLAECTAIGPEGGYAGWRQTLRVGL